MATIRRERAIPWLAVVLAAAAAVPGSADATMSVNAVRDTQKIRPTDPPPPSQGSISLSCAQNEFCAFQIAVTALDASVTVTDLSASDLVEPGGEKLSGSSALIYREGFLNISTISNSAGLTGLWPDPLIPKVDDFYQETRNAFPAADGGGRGADGGSAIAGSCGCDGTGADHAGLPWVVAAVGLRRHWRRARRLKNNAD
jgi:hypothetical protein